MERRMLLVVGFCVASLSAQAQGVGDVFPLPPEQEIISSPKGNCQFKITAVDHWKTFTSTGWLTCKNGGPARQWKRVLPHEYRPRFAVVTDSGSVVTVDDWPLTASPRALVIYKSDGSVLRQYSLFELARIIGKSIRSIQDGARMGLGWWLTDRPRIPYSSAYVTISTAGGRLDVDTATGDIMFCAANAKSTLCLFPPWATNIIQFKF